jgi:hypothetical protein
MIKRKSKTTARLSTLGSSSAFGGHAHVAHTRTAGSRIMCVRYRTRGLNNAY